MERRPAKPKAAVQCLTSLGKDVLASPTCPAMHLSMMGVIQGPQFESAQDAVDHQSVQYGNPHHDVKSMRHAWRESFRMGWPAP